MHSGGSEYKTVGDQQKVSVDLETQFLISIHLLRSKDYEDPDYYGEISAGEDDSHASRPDSSRRIVCS
uniref:Uncharacterized protein n=1 Tax=Angiostrongylus cantonensis TaxID=6313 RepID=A0A0K0CYS6_ANGCA